jgi:hypothetical protein
MPKSLTIDLNSIPCVDETGLRTTLAEATRSHAERLDAALCELAASDKPDDWIVAWDDGRVEWTHAPTGAHVVHVGSSVRAVPPGTFHGCRYTATLGTVRAAKREGRIGNQRGPEPQ